MPSGKYDDVILASLRSNKFGRAKKPKRYMNEGDEPRARARRNPEPLLPEGMATPKQLEMWKEYEKANPPQKRNPNAPPRFWKSPIDPGMLDELLKEKY